MCSDGNFSKKVGCWGVKASEARFHTPTFPRIIEMILPTQLQVDNV